MVRLAWDVRSLQIQTSGVYSKGNTLKFGPKVTHRPVDLSVADIRSQKNWRNGYRYHNGHNGEPIGNHHRSFEWCHR